MSELPLVVFWYEVQGSTTFNLRTINYVPEHNTVIPSDIIGNVLRLRDVLPNSSLEHMYIGSNPKEAANLVLGRYQLVGTVVREIRKGPAVLVFKKV